MSEEELRKWKQDKCFIEHLKKDKKELQARIDKASEYLEMARVFAEVDKKIILSVSTLERILQGSE